MNKTINTIILSVAALALFSCTSGSEWTPGPPEAEGSVGAYFADTNETDLIFSPEDNAVAAVLIGRVKTDSAADVPVTVVCDTDALKFPDSVHFDEGQEFAPLVIDYSSLEMYVQANYFLSIPDEHVYVYNNSRFNSFKGSMLISQWENVNSDGSDVVFTFEDSYGDPSCFAPYESVMEVLPGANPARYRINDFMGGGSYFEFTLKASTFTKFSGFYRIVPEARYLSDDYGYVDNDDYYHMWMLLGDADEDAETEDEDDDTRYRDYVLKDLKGNEVSFYWPCFYWYSISYGNEFSYVSLKGETIYGGEVNGHSYGCMWLCFETDETGLSCPQYFYVKFEWDK